MGPLAGTTVVEIAALGPVPICGMMLADFGADVILVERQSENPNAIKAASEHSSSMFYKRGKKSVVLDLKQPQGVDAILQLCERADVLIGHASSVAPACIFRIESIDEDSEGRHGWVRTR